MAVCPECKYQADDEAEFCGALCWDCVDDDKNLTFLGMAAWMYLGDLPYVLFDPPRADITKGDGRYAVARWLARHMKGVMEYLQ